MKTDVYVLLGETGETYNSLVSPENHIAERKAGETGETSIGFSRSPARPLWS